MINKFLASGNSEMVKKSINAILRSKLRLDDETALPKEVTDAYYEKVVAVDNLLAALNDEETAKNKKRFEWTEELYSCTKPLAICKLFGGEFYSLYQEVIVGIDYLKLKNFKIREFESLVTAEEKKLSKEISHLRTEMEIKKTKKRIEQQERKAKRSRDVLAELRSNPKAAPGLFVSNLINALDWQLDKHGNKQFVKSTQDNANLIFEYDPEIHNLFGYDEFAKQDAFLKAPAWKSRYWTDEEVAGTQWTDADDAHLRAYLRKTYTEFKGVDLISDTFTVFSRRNSFHPVKRYLENLRWDGKQRAEEFFIKYLGVEDTTYAREVTIKWLLGAVSRIYHEGCDFQYALVLHGAQGIGKSYVLKMLGGGSDKWFVKLVDSLDDPHAIDTIQKAWITEIEEWVSGRRAELNAQKSFLSRGADTRRAAYERRAETVPRHCVFAITLNDEEFLKDKTGNRRYKILHCRNKMNQHGETLTAETINQIWAEVYAKYKDLFKDKFDDNQLKLSAESEKTGEQIADTHIQDDALEGEIDNFLNTKIPAPVIWELLTKDERRKFFVDRHICFELAEINSRIRAQFGTAEAQRRINEVDSYIRNFSFNNPDDDADGGAVRREQISIPNKDGNLKITKEIFYFYGCEERQATCAAEIFNEMFGSSDKRKNMIRINEVLSKLDGWAQENRRQKNFAGAYGDQKKIYSRLVVTIKN